MKTPFSRFRPAIFALCAAALAASQASALPLALPEQQGPVVKVAADCYAIGQQVAAQNGGTLAKASHATRGGQAGSGPAAPRSWCRRVRALAARKREPVSGQLYA